MTVNLSMLAGAGAQFFDNNGIPLVGGLVYTYTAGTTTPQAAYTTSAGSIAHANPIVLDSSGRVPSGGEIWLTDAIAYKFVLKTATATTIGTYDNVTGNASGIYAAFAASSGSSLIGFIQAGTGAVATTVQTKLRQNVNLNDFGADPTGVADSTSAFTAAIAAVNKGGTIFLNGVYSISKEILITKTLSIVGQDSRTGNLGAVPPYADSKSCIVANSATDGAAINVSNCVGTLRNLVVYNGTAGAITTNGVRCTGANGSLKIDSIVVQGFEIGISSTTNYYNKITNTTVTYCDTGLLFDYCYNVYLAGMNIRCNETPIYSGESRGLILTNGSTLTMVGGAIESFLNAGVDLINGSSIDLFGVYFEGQTAAPTSACVRYSGQNNIRAIGCQAYLTASRSFIQKYTGSAYNVRVISKNNQFVYPTNTQTVIVYDLYANDPNGNWDISGDNWDTAAGPNVSYNFGGIVGNVGNYKIEYPINHPSFLLSPKTQWSYMTPSITTPILPTATSTVCGYQPIFGLFANSGFVGTAVVTTAGTPTGLTYTTNVGTLSTVVITGTAGQFSCASTTLVVGQQITISGTLGGTGSITGYVNPTTYYIIATNGTTTFTLSASGGDDPVGLRVNYGLNAYYGVYQKGQWEKIGARLPNQANSTASTVGDLVTDFNSLLSKLRDNGIMV
jgi:hypothetical protein